jgi:hypothetical protein
VTIGLGFKCIHPDKGLSFAFSYSQILVLVYILFSHWLGSGSLMTLVSHLFIHPYELEMIFIVQEMFGRGYVRC